MTDIQVVTSSPSIADPSALVIKGPNNDGLLYRWKLGDCLASIAISYCRPSSDWKVLYELNKSLYYRRHNVILEGDLIKIPQEWIDNKARWEFDKTRIEPGNQDLVRESHLLLMYNRLEKDFADV